MDTFLKWSELAGSKREIVNECADAWNSLLDADNACERDYHAFIDSHAGLFFGHPAETFFVMSEIELGSDFRVDLVVPRDRKSEGTAYELIELEIPSLKPYSDSGDPYARFVHAVQQTLDWKTWLADHRDCFDELFPSSSFTASNARIQFTVIAGRRTDDIVLQRKRNEFARSVGVKIRSFDYLTELLQARLFLDFPAVKSAQFEELDKSVLNELANPFFHSWKSKAWRQLSKQIQGPHAVAKSANAIIQNRVYNQGLLKKFNDSGRE